jgi:tRNA (adenine57-N1/adenine58-N1)-methyltransferase
VEVAGGRKVKDVLAGLAIDPDTVLVIKERTLLTREERVEEGDRIEIRPVISGGSGSRRAHTKCKRCRAPAVIELRRHNAAFCRPCFLKYFHDQVKRAIDDHDMFGPGDRVLVAVSGGKDSLALWDVLLGLGYLASGMYLGLGIGDYSDRSGEACRRFAAERGADLVQVDLRAEYGFDVPTAGGTGSRATCSVCGLSKRYIFNRVALDHGFDVVATGHNLDDEAATLLGNTLRWQTEYMARQYPVLTERRGRPPVPRRGGGGGRPGRLRAVRPAHHRQVLRVLPGPRPGHGGAAVATDRRAAVPRDLGGGPPGPGVPVVSTPFEPGERVLLIDSRGRRFLVRLQVGGMFHFHGGAVPHDLILGSEEGTVVHSTTGAGLVCLRPTLADFVLKMPRGAQVVYPKDVGAILVEADIAPGTSVLEAGTGSGALTIALCRATGPEGRVVSYEARADFHQHAGANLETYFAKLPEWLDLRLGDVREVASTGETFDRVVLDLPEPWAVLEEIGQAVRAGAILCTYLPTTNQVQEAVLALEAAGFSEPHTIEVLVRSWHVTKRSVRPDHRMVAHTGFITVARKG